MQGSGTNKFKVKQILVGSTIKIRFNVFIVN